jgi:8-oxo-dGTP pyrophosphatase MutT (NUDIX family)
VPYAERLRWFAALREWLDAPRYRRGVRAVLLDEDDRVLLVRFRFPTGVSLWATPGGGIDRGESDEEALRRELAEEAGLHAFELGPLVWTRLHRWEDLNPRWDGQEERYYLVRVAAFEPRPELTAEQLAAEYLYGIRWWTLDELARSNEAFAPEGLPGLVGQLAREGPPAVPEPLG